MQGHGYCKCWIVGKWAEGGMLVVGEVDLWDDWITGCAEGGNAEERTQAKYAEIRRKELDEVLPLQLPDTSRNAGRVRFNFHSQGKIKQYNTTRSHINNHPDAFQNHLAKTSKEEPINHKNSIDKEQPKTNPSPTPTQKAKNPQLKKRLKGKVTRTEDPKVPAEAHESILIFQCSLIMPQQIDH